jgi:quinohemoprotein ethanol dehydrogenase
MLYLLGALGTASAATPTKFAAVDDSRLRNAASEPGEWFTVGRDGQGTYYSPLDQINSGNVTKLGFAWEYRLGTYHGLEATPIVVDGVMYTTGITGLVYALDARTGKLIWSFDPNNNPQTMRFVCCDIVNRGVAIKNGVVYVGSLDGRLFALDAATGKKRWSVDTVIDQRLEYTITDAPQLTKDLVVIGNSGADMGVGGVRGYVSAYDLKTGALRWRFYTVPKPGEKNPTPEMLAAEKTWDPKRSPLVYGGGTVWDGMAYDPDLDLVYFGTGNAAPYQGRDRSPSGGDNLYVASIIALHAATGRMAWYYQTTPGDSSDYDADAKLILADLTIEGRERKTILQANKNGYFYVIDRGTGKVISAKPFTYQNWSKGMDANFKPIISEVADHSQEAKVQVPAFAGAHAWQPMSYDLQTGLVYIPALEAPMVIFDLRNNPGSTIPFVYDFFETYMYALDRTFDLKSTEEMFGKMPNIDLVDPKTGRSLVRTVLKAWNPVTQKQVWVRPVSGDVFAIEGGAMSTAGNLVFQGTSKGELRIYAADTGKLLHSIQTGTSIMAAPSTYMIDGVQYVAVMAGYGGSTLGLIYPPDSAAARYDNEGRILVFRLGGTAGVPRTHQRVMQPMAQPPPEEGSPADIAEGGRAFAVWCARCHQFGIGLTPDLRRLEGGIGQLDLFKRIVLGGLLAPGGMGRFDDLIKPRDVEQIHAYLIDEAHQLYAEEHASKH